MSGGVEAAYKYEANKKRITILRDEIKYYEEVERVSPLSADQKDTLTNFREELKERERYE